MKISQLYRTLCSQYTPTQLSRLLGGKVSPRQILHLNEDIERVVEEGEGEDGKPYRLTVIEPKSHAFKNLDEIFELLLPYINAQDVVNNLVALNERRKPLVSGFVLYDADGKQIATYKENQKTLAAHHLIEAGDGASLKIIRESKK